MTQTVPRYHAVAVLLHWLIAVMIIGLMVAGLWMTGAIRERETQKLAFEVYQLHKSVGLTVLVLSLLRLAWRLSHRSPPLPGNMAAWERAAAHGTHWLFYGLMFALPVSGWLMVSASPLGLPTLYFSGPQVPHLPALADLPMTEKKVWDARLKDIHEYLAFGGMALIALHVGAAFRHHFILRDGLLGRMLPLRPRNRKDLP
jgi:cytochrome b561